VKKLGRVYLYDVLGSPKRKQPVRLLGKSHNPFNLRSRYFVEFEDGEALFTGRLLRAPRHMQKVA
jgi:hypothetical protein